MMQRCLASRRLKVGLMPAGAGLAGGDHQDVGRRGDVPARLMALRPFWVGAELLRQQRQLGRGGETTTHRHTVAARRDTLDAQDPAGARRAARNMPTTSSTVVASSGDL